MAFSQNGQEILATYSGDHIYLFDMNDTTPTDWGDGESSRSYRRRLERKERGESDEEYRDRKRRKRSQATQSKYHHRVYCLPIVIFNSYYPLIDFLALCLTFSILLFIFILFLSPLETADEHKRLGNKAFRKERYHLASYHFTKAIEKDPTQAIYFSNRAATKFRLAKRKKKKRYIPIYFHSFSNLLIYHTNIVSN